LGYLAIKDCLNRASISIVL